jgi:hypothetical protein
LVGDCIEGEPAAADLLEDLRTATGRLTYISVAKSSDDISMEDIGPMESWGRQNLRLISDEISNGHLSAFA